MFLFTNIKFETAYIIDNGVHYQSVNLYESADFSEKTVYIVECQLQCIGNIFDNVEISQNLFQVDHTEQKDH